MIATIRNQFQKSGKIILWLIILSMAGGMIVSLISKKNKNDAIGSVNGYDISRADYQNKLRQENQYMAMLRQQLGTEFESLLGHYGKPEERIITQFVNEKLLQSAADKIGMQVSPDYIIHKLGDQQFVMQALSGLVPQEAFYGRNGINMEAVMHYLKRQGVSDADFEQIVANSVKMKLLSELVGTTSYVTNAQLKEAYIAQFVAKKYGIATTAISTYIEQVKKAKPTIAKDELEAFFYKHSSDYMVPEKRSAKVWSFKVEDYNLPASDKEISEYYTKNKKNYIDKPEQMQVRVLRVAVPDKADSNKKASLEREAEELMKKAKAQPALFAKDGKLVTLSRKDTHGPAAFALEADGDISSLLSAKDGFEILQRVSRKDATFKNQADVKKDIAATIKEDKFAKQFNLDGQRIISQAADDASYLKKFVEDKKGQLEVVKESIQDGSLQARKIFGLKENGRAFYTEGKKGFIVELTALTKTFLPKLQAIESKVTADFYKAEAVDSMDKALHQALIKLNQGAALEAVAKELNASYEKTDWIKPDKKDAYADLEKKKIPVTRLKTLMNKGNSIEELSDTHGYLIQVIDVEKIDDKAIEQKRDQLQAALGQEQMQTSFSAFIAQLRKNATIDLAKEVQRYYK